MDEKHHNLKHLIEWTEEPIPPFFRDLSAEQLYELHGYTQNVVDYETDGLEELYYTISTIMKYIPNFVLLPLITNYIKPPIAAGVCAELSLKEASNLASGLPVEYLGEVALHMDSEWAAEIFSKLKSSLAEKCIEYEVSHHPMKSLDIGQYVDTKLLKKASKYLHLLETVDETLLEDYAELIDEIRSFES